MKFFFILSFLLFLTIDSYAETFKSKVHSIELSPESGKDHLVYFTGGQVLFISSKDKSTLDSFQKSIEADDVLEIERNSKNRLESVKSVSDELTINDNEGGSPPEGDKLNLLSPQGIFNSMKRGWQNQSQCYNRAHVWTYEASNNGINMSKLFLFFTKRYIYNYNYGWWFHVTPTLANGSSWLTMDRRYTRGPLNVKTWTNIFIYSRRTCPIVYKYSQYSNNQYSEDCYLIPTTKYFWQPRDILNYERYGRQKTRFISSEVSWAYEEAF